jgi:hypothetical protein
MNEERDRMNEERDWSDLNVYGADDFEELDMILAALDRALDTDGQTSGSARVVVRSGYES